MPRVVSSLFVAAIVRRANGAGAFAVVARRGAAEAGAIFVKVARLDGSADLYGPAPQALVDSEDDGDRRFERLVEGGADADVEARLAREARFDPDFWVVEIEDREGRSFVELARPG